MEYKGIEYSVVQTVCPTGWIWAAQFPAIQISAGKASSKPEAVRLAQLAIEKAIAVASSEVTPGTPEAPTDAMDLRQRYAELQRLRVQVRELEVNV